MKYDERACHFNMDTGCVELRLRDGRINSTQAAVLVAAVQVLLSAVTAGGRLRIALDSFCIPGRQYPTIDNRGLSNSPPG